MRIGSWYLGWKRCGLKRKMNCFGGGGGGGKEMYNWVEIKREEERLCSCRNEETEIRARYRNHIVQGTRV